MNAIVVNSYFQLPIGCAKISRKYIFKTPNKCDQPIFDYKKDNVYPLFGHEELVTIQITLLVF